MAIKTTLKKILAVVFAFVSAVALFFIGRKSKDTQPESAEVYAEKKKNEMYKKLEKTPADTLIDNSVNADKHIGTISALQGKFRDRVRARFEQVL